MKFSVVIAALASTAACAQAANDWSYKTPVEWATKYPTCGGKSQSPIDFSIPASDKKTAPISFTGSCSSYKLTQQYDAFTADVQGGSCGVSLDNKVYSFNKMTLRTPGEHTLNGFVYEGELQFEYSSKDGQRAVMSLLLRQNDFLQTNDFVAKFWSGIPAVSANTTSSVTLGSFESILKTRLNNGRVFKYSGSLTTPSCDENVEHWVLESPLYVKSADVKRLRSQRPRIEASDNGNNARAVQPLNGRSITVY